MIDNQTTHSTSKNPMIYLYAMDIWQTYLKSRLYEVISTSQ